MNEPEIRPSGAGSDVSEPGVIRQRGPRWFWRLHRLLPWASLGLGILGAILMDRGPKRAALVAFAASGLWLVLTASHFLLRAELGSGTLGPVRRGLVRVARYSSELITQSIVQLCLFFSLPFYFRAATLGASDLDAGHALFMLGLSLLCGVSLWDPWTAWLLRRPLLSPVLPAAASFVALDTVLPGFGISTQHSLWLSAGSTVLGVALLLAGAAPPGKRLKRAAKAAGLGLLIPIGLGLGAARIVPPAPLRLMHADFGVARRGKWIDEPVTQLASPPERLFCATAIASPSGLHDRLFHVWRKDGVERARMGLDIIGGRQDGYRTVSWLQAFGSHAAGRYSCSVMTASGQLLGTRHIQIGAAQVGGP